MAKEENFLTEEITLEEIPVRLPTIQGTPTELMIDPDQRWLYVQSQGDEMTIINIANLSKPFIHSVTDLTSDDANVH